MVIQFKEIMEAFDFVSYDQRHAHQAFLCKETGKIYWHSEFGDNVEELPEDIVEDKYIEIPQKNELNLGKKLVLEFTYQYLPDYIDKIESIFSKKGAYSRYKALLEKLNMLESWYEFESKTTEEKLRTWCQENSIEVQG